MKKLSIVLLFLSGCHGCGLASKDNEMVGQVKKVVDETPVICPNISHVDVSLGVLRDGTGSMSKEDVHLHVPDAAHRQLLKEAAESGRPVKILYNDRRWPICYPDLVVTSVEYLAMPTKPCPEAKQ